MKGDCKYIVDRLKNSMVFNYPIYITLFLNLKCYNSQNSMEAVWKIMINGMN
jgi:hypothetical protein